MEFGTNFEGGVWKMEQDFEGGVWILEQTSRGGVWNLEQDFSPSISPDNRFFAKFFAVARDGIFLNLSFLLKLYHISSLCKMYYSLLSFM